MKPLRPISVSLALTAFALVGTITTARAADAVVPGDFGTIQAAVNGATDTDGNGFVEILVAAGTYLENVEITRSELWLRGEDAATTTISGSGLVDTVRIKNTSRVRLSGFTVTNDGQATAVKVEDSTQCLVDQNVMTGTRRGISLTRATANMIRLNTVTANTRGGIKVGGSSNGNTIHGNTVTGNTDFGIGIDRGDGNTVSSNTVSGTVGEGIGGRRGDNNLFTGNSCTGNTGNGLRFRTAVGTVVSGNIASNNGRSGIRTRETTGSLITANQFDDNAEWGIRFRDSVSDDFDATTPGVQDPPGDNSVVGNTLGPIHQD